MLLPNTCYIRVPHQSFRLDLILAERVQGLENEYCHSSSCKTQNGKSGTSRDTNLRHLHLRFSFIALRKSKPIFGLIIHKTHFFHRLNLVPVGVAICVTVCIYVDLPVCISVGVFISRAPMEYRPFHDLGCGFFSRRELLQLISRGGEGGDASEL